MPENISASKLSRFREAMAGLGLQAYIVPSQDPHQSEYVAPHWQTRSWLTGFTGSAGTAVVTDSHAGLWTDSRYFLQAEQELTGSGFSLEKLKVPHTPEYLSWLAGHLPAGSRIGADSRLLSLGQARAMRRFFEPHGLELAFEDGLVDKIWAGRPPLPKEPARLLAEDLAGQPAREKLDAIRQQMGGVDYYLVTALDEIAWALNIRGQDVDYNPVVISYLVIGQRSAHWFVDPGKVDATVEAGLSKSDVSVHPYEELAGWLLELEGKARVGYDAGGLTAFLYGLLPAEQWASLGSLVAPLKAIRNPAERANLKKAMRKDGVALLRLARWLEHTLAEGEEVTEFEVGQKLTAFRAAQPGYQGDSFGAIVGYQGNGAIVHYSAKAETAAAIRPEGVLLLDSGGQYLEGTTDITRTFALGPVSGEVKDRYTRVLKGYIGLARAVFPEGTTGVQLDILARQHLWAAGLNYGHGTGHGVGHFLNVHEGPQSITPNPRSPKGQQPIQEGMLQSNEPGYYEPGAFGIRIENLELCVLRQEGSHGRFLGFEPQTLFPIATDLVDREMLAPEEVAWLNEYHARVFQELAPLLNEEEQHWLKLACRPLA
ncbi:aminopeptidase P family protein [Phaeodactylibacter luteus]|uniref:Aminopeptidase P family protein n=1 Tax=Phaeodactylibacter luteus TaxID=1564516 RepID=A0A5C6RWJ5_9BACT|nr:aminopeptidase P family protein [Phaeodactylibacter luteus]TXB66229.1 aminopeptidase P family protein [Phaeodactylibacter luteus]